MSTDRYEQLPELPPLLPRTSSEKSEETDEQGNISQWRILKVLKEVFKNSATPQELADHFSIKDPYSQRLQFGVQQLLRGRKIRETFGTTRQKTFGTIYQIVFEESTPRSSRD
jgi:hypothetical protein